MSDPSIILSEAEMADDIDVPVIPDSAKSMRETMDNFLEVIFHDVQDIYKPGSDLKVSYTITNKIQPTSRDWIGLFRVGWGTPRDYCTYVWSPKPTIEKEDGSKEQSVTFTASQLPGEDQDFHQFCYMTKHGDLRGASLPFLFRHRTENDCLFQVEDENGMIILKTKSDALEEQLSKVTAEKQALQQSVDDLTISRQKLSENLDELTGKLTASHELLKTVNENNVELESKIADLASEHEKVVKRLSKADSRIEKTKAELAEAQNTILSLQNETLNLNEEIKKVEEARAADVKKHEEEMRHRDEAILQTEAQNIEMRDTLQALSLTRDKLKQTAHESLGQAEKKLEDLRKEKEAAVTKMKQYREERNLFRAEHAESELERQKAIEKWENMLQRVEAMDEQMRDYERALGDAQQNVITAEKKMEAAKKKNKHELNHMNDALRNSSEQVNALETSKKLLRNELTEVTETRDKLMLKLNKMKKDRDALDVELRGTQSALAAIQCQLDTAENKLEASEEKMCLLQEGLMAERSEADVAEREMHDENLRLRHLLEESDKAVAEATDRNQYAVSRTKDQKTQTKKKQHSDIQVQACSSNDGGESAEAKIAERDSTIAELTAKVDEYSKRLSMGADVYKKKSKECNDLERKVKKLTKKLAKQPPPTDKSRSSCVDATKPSSSVQTESVATTTGNEDDENPGIMNSIGKLIMAIADPEPDEQEVSTSMQAKLQEMEKAVQVEHSRFIKYKQLYNDEKRRVQATHEESHKVEVSLRESLDLQKVKCQMLSDENKMLKVQMQEFIESSPDGAMAFFRRGDSADEDATGSSTDPDSANSNPLLIPGDDEGKFEDAPGVPMFYPPQMPHSASSESNSDDQLDYSRSPGFPKITAMCPDPSRDNASDVTTGARSAPISCAKYRVVNRQPVRSPPQHSNEAMTSRATSSTASQQNKKSSKTRKRRSSKKVSSVM